MEEKPEIYLRSVVQNYYTASNALMSIGTTENLPTELRNICIQASNSTSKIIDYVNKHKEEFI